MTAVSSAAVRFRRGRSTIVPAVAAAYLLDVVFAGCVIGYGSRYLLHELHSSSAYPGYALAIYGLLKLVGALVGGRLMDASGILVAVALSAMAEVAAFATILVSGSAGGYLAGVAMLSFGIEIAWLVVFRAIGDASESDRRASLTAAMSVVALAALGSGILLSILLARTTSSSPSFLLTGAMAVVSTVLLVQLSAHTRLAPPTAAPRLDRRRFSEFRALLPLLVAAHFAVLAGSLAVYTPYVLRRLDLDLFHAGLVAAPAAIVAAAAMWLVGNRSRPGRRLAEASGWYVVAAIAMFISAHTHSLVAFGLLAIPLGAALAVTTPLMTAGLIDSAATSESPGSAFGALFFMEGLGGIAGPALVGAAISLKGISMGATLIGVLTLSLGGIALGVSRRRTS